MILTNRNEYLKLCFRVRVEDFDYVLFDSSAHMKFFSCGEMNHLKMCLFGSIRTALSGSGEHPSAVRGPTAAVLGSDADWLSTGA